MSKIKIYTIFSRKQVNRIDAENEAKNVGAKAELWSYINMKFLIEDWHRMYDALSAEGIVIPVLEKKNETED